MHIIFFIAIHYNTMMIYCVSYNGYYCDSVVLYLV